MSTVNVSNIYSVESTQSTSSSDEPDSPHADGESMLTLERGSDFQPPIMPILNTALDRSSQTPASTESMDTGNEMPQPRAPTDPVATALMRPVYNSVMDFVKVNREAKQAVFTLRERALDEYRKSLSETPEGGEQSFFSGTFWLDSLDLGIESNEACADLQLANIDRVSKELGVWFEPEGTMGQGTSPSAPPATSDKQVEKHYDGLDDGPVKAGHSHTSNMRSKDTAADASTTSPDVSAPSLGPATCSALGEHLVKLARITGQAHSNSDKISRYLGWFEESIEKAAGAKDTLHEELLAVRKYTETIGTTKQELEIALRKAAESIGQVLPAYST